MYPNPFTDYARISFANMNYSAVQFELRDMTGTIVQRQNHPATEHICVNRSDLATGMYIFTIDMEGEQITGKLMIE